MYTLRIISENDKLRTANQSLGNDYSVTYKNSPLFEETSKPAICNENTYAVVVGNEGKIVYPLFKGNDYFIMTESGKTFEKL